MSEIAFVEEYRKELAKTGYPFVSPLPLTTTTGYLFPLGGIADAAVYYDAAGSIPKLTALEKSGGRITFAVGGCRGTRCGRLLKRRTLYRMRLIVPDRRLSTLRDSRLVGTTFPGFQNGLSIMTPFSIL